ncbi:PfkB family carbohydrate kinase [Methanobrevibacter oralis]|uniref:PfkB family carbohydrate kinase n=1 Tax=Methanobrevibacter oralis TaxID=66851 RepID=A0A166C3A5_METOA|nr:PfkB family carbohydrate kinase [Methanobrevibacter oralis]KZX14088.1 pfkB family carbohydrate kinase [Methanobrevibacter oralis]
MTLICIGPVTKDLIIVGSEKSFKVGGATYFQSFVFEEYFNDYLAIVNTSSKELINEFPDISKVKVLLKEDTHYFINHYPKRDNLDLRHQLSNFAKIPILKKDLENILKNLKIDAIVLNPLNRYDFPKDTIEYLKSFNVPIYLSIQGFLRCPHEKFNDYYTIKLKRFDDLDNILSGINGIFLDEDEAAILGDVEASEIVITNGSKGSRIISGNEIKIKAVECSQVADSTGCGDTYMAAYISKRLKGGNIKESGDFASKISSCKLEKSGPFLIS